MMKKSVFSTLTIGSALVLASAGVSAAENPFSAQVLSSGYELASADKHMEGKCGEGKCGGDTDSKKDAEGKCGADKDHKKDAEGKCGGDKDHKKDAEG